ncbi:hypothetical protein [Arcicella rosea]|uniref:Uncharacterized protein n=1 Tax=Arcicella rosea TaxID=502909 RepID=A0A841EFX3_9BACT|nr:hypothetical protein [Arcicella rosea]MBB6002212.1 hypothetical protein [Arcicella rosea]
MKQLGVKKLYVIVSLMFSFIIESCRFNKLLVKANKIDNDYYTYFSNSILDTKISFYGDYVFEKKIKPLKIEEHDNFLSNKRITNLFYTKTTTSPFFHCYGFVLNKNDSIFYKSHGFKTYKKNILIGSIKKTKENVFLPWIISCKNYDLCLQTSGSLAENINENYTIDFISNILQKEFEEITSSAILLSLDTMNNLENPFKLAEKSFKSLKRGNYINPITNLKANEEKYKLDSTYRDLFFQSIITYYTFLGDREMTELYKKEFYGNENPWQDRLSGIDFKENYITEEKVYAEMLSSNQVIMFNESHIHPMNRYVISKMLPLLKEKGFKYLALEGINEDARVLMKRGYPTIDTGFYTREYQMANLIRHALKLGFILVDYEDYEEGNREYNQAQNLFSKTIKKDSTSKLIVLAGGSHIDENSVAEHKWMAEFFKKISNINPLTINQTRLNEIKTNNVIDAFPIVFLNATNKKDTVKNDIFLLNNYNGYNHILTYEDCPHLKLSLHDFTKAKKTKNLIQIFIWEEYKKSKNVLPCFSYYGIETMINLKVPNGYYVVHINEENEYKKILIKDMSISFVD